MSLPGLNSSFSNADLNAMQATAANGLNAPSNGFQQVRTSSGQVFLETVQIVDQGPITPFQVNIAEGDGGSIIYRVAVGTVNNVVPLINGVPLTNPNVYGVSEPTSAGSFFVAIKCYADPAPARFPKTNSEIVIVTDVEIQNDTDGYGYIGLATLVLGPAGPNRSRVLNQLVSGSLWAERHKYTEPNTASYFFYRV